MAAPPITERHLHHFHRRSPIKESVRAATTGNITISTALNNGDSLDGVTLATDDRVLVKDQTTGSENGLYVVGTTPVRAYDQSTDDPAFGYLVYVREGTANGGTLWRNTNTTAPTVGTTALTFATSTALTDPMTTRGDIIVRNASNVTARLGIGSAGKILSSDGTDVSWGNGPMTTQDDLIIGGASGIPTRLAKGSDSQVLTVDPTTHHLVWATPSSGFSNPMTTKGDLIVGDTGGSAIRKAVGSDGQVLTADAASTGGIKWAAGGGGGSGALVFLEAHTASSSASLDFTTFISSTYDSYVFELVGLVPATTNTELWLRMGTGGGPTFDTGANYSYRGIYDGVGDSLTMRGATGASKIQLLSNQATTAGYAMTGKVDLWIAGGTLYPFIESRLSGVVSGNPYWWQQNGWYVSSTTLTGVQFLMSSGNIASGIIRVYGITKS